MSTQFQGESTVFDSADARTEGEYIVIDGVKAAGAVFKIRMALHVARRLHALMAIAIEDARALELGTAWTQVAAKLGGAGAPEH